MMRVKRLAWLLLVLVLGLSQQRCKGPIAGECMGKPGHLCITVKSPLPPPLPYTGYSIEVRTGTGCGCLDDLAKQQAQVAQSCPDPLTTPSCQQPLSRVPCKISQVPVPVAGSDGGLFAPVPPRLDQAGTFTADIDLSNDPGPGEALVTVFTSGTCQAHGTASWSGPAAPAQLSVELDPTRCADWHQPCAHQVDCGGPEKARICCNSMCIDPPNPAVPGAPPMAFIPAGTYIEGSVTGDTDEQPCPSPFTVGPLYVDVQEASVGQMRQFIGTCGAPCAGLKPQARGALYTDLTDGPFCTYTEDDTITQHDPDAQRRSVNCITQAQAQMYCQMRNQSLFGVAGDLPTEIEWEWLAGRSDPKLTYPFSADPNAQAPTGCDGSPNAALGVDGAFCQQPTEYTPPVRPPGTSPGDLTPASFPWPQPQLADLTSTTDSEPTSRCTDQSGGTSLVARGGDFWRGPDYLKVYRRTAVPLAAFTTSPFFYEMGLRCVVRLPVSQ
jgi:formylglycine-generating enzyme required for sulfatase activity